MPTITAPFSELFIMSFRAKIHTASLMLNSYFCSPKTCQRNENIMFTHYFLTGYFGNLTKSSIIITKKIIIVAKISKVHA